MAKVYSHSQGRAKGSVGMTTYRTVRGRVIESQKISPWEPEVMERGKAKRWSNRTALLGIIAIFMKNHANSVNNSFNKTKYGSARNFFMKQNFGGLKAAFSPLAEETALTHIFPNRQQIEDALGEYAEANPNAIYRVYKAGEPVMMLTGNWSDADDPAAIKYNLIVISADSSKGLVKINDGEFSANASALVSAGNSATIAAQAQEGFVFDKWSDGDLNPSRQIVVTEDKTLTAQFKAQAAKATLSFTKEYEGYDEHSALDIVVKVDGEEKFAGQTSGTLEVDKGSSVVILCNTLELESTPEIQVNGTKVAEGTGSQRECSYTLTVTANATVKCIAH